jgi:hypothetical protein
VSEREGECFVKLEEFRIKRGGMNEVVPGWRKE